MNKAYHLMSEQERREDRIRKNREIDANVATTKLLQNIKGAAKTKKMFQGAVKDLDRALIAQDGYGIPSDVLAKLGMYRVTVTRHGRG